VGVTFRETAFNLASTRYVKNCIGVIWKLMLLQYLDGLVRTEDEQFDLGAAALERRPSIRKINELGLFDLVAAMA
jgi:hypothetical protein